MSTFRNPVGPQPSKVYWRRRLVVLVALILVVIIAIAVISSVASGASKGATPSQGTGAAANPNATTSAGAPAVAGGPCLAAQIKIVANTDKASYAAGENPKLSFSITNSGTVSCTYNVGSTQQTYVVSSGAEQYWSSKDCELTPVDTPLLLEPNVAMTSAAVDWDRTRSSTTTCAATTRPAVPAGGATYSLTVTVGSAKAAAPKAFLLN